MSQLIEQNSLLKKNLSFAQDNKENQQQFVAGKVKNLQELIEKQEIKVESVYRKAEWRRKINTLSEEYQKNIEILQKEYLKAVINLTANEFNIGKETVKSLINKTEANSF